MPPHHPHAHPHAPPQHAHPHHHMPQPRWVVIPYPPPPPMVAAPPPPQFAKHFAAGPPPPPQAGGRRTPTPPATGSGGNACEENKTIWVGDLQYWMDENYLHSCFGPSGEVCFSPDPDFCVLDLMNTGRFVLFRRVDSCVSASYLYRSLKLLNCCLVRIKVWSF